MTAETTTLSGTPDFESGVLDFAGKLRSFLRKRVADPTDAEDLAQEVLLKVFRSKASLRDASKLESWLYQTARGTVIDYYRKRRPTAPLPPELGAESHEFDDIGERLRRSVRRFLLVLPEIYRMPLELSEFEGLTAAEIARRLKLSESAVKSRLTRGRSLLRDKLVDCCQFEFDRFGKIIDLQQRAPCACDDPDGECSSGVADRLIYELAREGDGDTIRHFLASAGLPTDDLTDRHFLTFFVARCPTGVAGTIGLELFGKIALLRSLAVAPTFQRSGIGSRLVAELERLGRQLGVKELFLLTTTAETFFKNQGFVRIDRMDAPTAIKETPEFRDLCPSTAVVLQKEMGIPVAPERRNRQLEAKTSR